MPFLKAAEGIAIHYDSIGNGPPLLFIHGWAMSGSVWRFQEGLADSYRFIVPDLRGHGLSSAPESCYSFDEFAQDLNELFSIMDLDKAIIIAWSMGVHVALRAYPLLRDRLAALVFVSGTSKFSSDNEYPYGLPAAAARGLGLRLQKDYEKTVRSFIRSMFTDDELSKGCYDLVVADENYAKFPEPQAAAASLKSLADADFRHVLPLVDLPVLLIHGNADTICPPTASRYMAGLLPSARLEIIEGAGHAPFLSRPTEFTAILKKFVDGIHTDD